MSQGAQHNHQKANMAWLRGMVERVECKLPPPEGIGDNKPPDSLDSGPDDENGLLHEPQLR